MPDIAYLQPFADRAIATYFRSGLSSMLELDRVFFLLW